MKKETKKFIFIIEDRESDGRSSIVGIYGSREKAFAMLSTLDNGYDHHFYGPHIDMWELNGNLVECCIDSKE